MLDPDVVLNSVVASLQSIPQLLAELGSPPVDPADAIRGHYFYAGEENSLARTLGQMNMPSMLVAYLDYLGGNFDGMTVWKHRLNMYLRPRNRAAQNGSASAQHLWWMGMNLPIAVPIPAANIRYVELANENLQLMDTPTLKYISDELGQDFFVSTMVFPEKGDAGPNPAVDYQCGGLPLAVEA